MARWRTHLRHVGRGIVRPKIERSSVSLFELRIRDVPGLLVRVYRQVLDERLLLLASSVAFYAFLALFPGISAILSVGALIWEPDTIAEAIRTLAGSAPKPVARLISLAVEDLMSVSGESLSIGLLLSIAFTFLVANRGVRSLMDGIAIAFDSEEARVQRGWVATSIISFGITTASIVFFLIATALFIAIPLIVSHVPVPSELEWTLPLLRWPLAGLIVALAIAWLFRVSAPKQAFRWRGLGPGSLIAMLLWSAASLLFTFYTDHIADYERFYGPLSTVAAAQVWLFASSATVLIGAKFDSEAGLLLASRSQVKADAKETEADELEK